MIRHRTKALALDAVFLVLFGHYLLDPNETVGWRVVDATLFTFSVFGLVQSANDARANDAVPEKERRRVELLLMILLGAQALKICLWLATVVR
jgi:hypothetical protein